jgi:hypothetical protein
LNSGRGFPLQQFDKAHVPTFTVDFSLALDNIAVIGLTAPVLKIKSLYYEDSPAIFPMHHKAYSDTSLFGLLKVFTISGIPPLSTIQWTYVILPEAIFVNPQQLSNYKCGSSGFFKSSSILGTRFISITF